MKVKSSIIFGVVLLLAISLGWVGGLFFKSPEDAVLPVAEVPIVSAKIESRTLDYSVTAPAQIQQSTPVSVYLKAPEGREGVVSATPLGVGDQVSWCKPLIEVSGRPLIALEGPVPSYRTLKEGDEGADVRQLQDALKKCGLYKGSLNGIFGPATATAVKQLYKQNNYVAPTSDVEVEQNQTTKSPAATSEESATQTTGTNKTLVKQIVTIPVGELEYFTATGTVSKIQALGSRLNEEPGLQFSNLQYYVLAQFAPVDRLLLEEGMDAQINIGSINIPVKLPAIANEPVQDTANNNALSYPALIPIDATQYGIDSAMLSAQVKVIVTVGADEVYPLVVPVTAVYEDSATGSYILKIVDKTDKSFSKVPVSVVASQGGYVAISTSEDELTVGDGVKLGG